MLKSSYKNKNNIIIISIDFGFDFYIFLHFYSCIYMSAKEERALNLELHRMNRAHNEMIARNAALESECARLRMTLKNETAKMVAKHDALLQTCAAYQAAEHKMLADLQMERQEMIATMQREHQETMFRLQEQMQKEAWTQKYEIKKTMEAQYADIISKKTEELDATKKRLEDELISEKKARIQREEEHVGYFWARVEEINALKAAQKQKWEEDKRTLEEEWQQRLDQANSQCMQLETQLELEKNERAHAESQINHYMSIANEQKRQMEKEQKEMALVIEKQFEERIHTLTMQLTKTISFSQLSHVIAANHAHIQLIHNLGFTGKRVLLYSHYSDRDEVESYNYLTLEHMDNRFDYVIVLTNCPNKWDLPNPNYNKYHVLCYNFKSDFRNYAVFIMQSAKKLMHASQLCLMNDSFVIVDVPAYERCMHCLFKSGTATTNVAHDFAGITSSHEGVYHMQSYFMLFNSTDVIKAVVNYFDVQGVPTNHNASISVYELGMTQHLINQGFTPYAMISNAEMQYPLNTTYYKWSAVLQHAGIIKRQHILKQYPMRFAMTDFNIALVANKFNENTHFIHFLKYHGIHVD